MSERLPEPKWHGGHREQHKIYHVQGMDGKPTLANDVEDSLESKQREIPGGGSEPTFPFIRNEHERLHT